MASSPRTHNRPVEASAILVRARSAFLLHPSFAASGAAREIGVATLGVPAASSRKPLAQQMLGNVDELDLARALIDAGGAKIAVEALDAAALDVTLAAEHLHDAVGDATAHLACQIFAER